VSNLQIKVIIAGRTYPLSVSSDEEVVIRKAVKNIEENLKKLEETYSIKDRQDLLAMYSLQMAMQIIIGENPKQEEKSDNNTRQLEELKDLLDEALSPSKKR